MRVPTRQRGRSGLTGSDPRSETPSVPSRGGATGSAGRPASLTVAVLAIAALLVGLLSSTAAAPAQARACQSWGAQPPQVGTGAVLYGLAARSACDVWAVGTANGPASTTLTVIERWNGLLWTAMPSPSPGSSQNSLLGVAVASAADAWAVGGYLDTTTDQPLIERWNGHAWSVIPSPTVGDAGSLADVVAFTHRDAWAVGYRVKGTVTHALIERWNGRHWKVSPIPNVGAGTSYLEAVGGTGTHDLWAVGSHVNANRTLALHWNGRRWKLVPSPTTGPFGTLRSVSAVSPDDVWAVGDHGPVIHALAEHWNGHRWRVVRTPDLGPLKGELAGVSMTSASDGWAVGYRTTGTQIQNLVEHWNGHRWSIAPTAPFGIQSILMAVVALSPQRAWAAGTFNDSVARPLVLGCC